MKLEKYSIGMGDRFGHQGLAQLAAVLKAKEAGVDISPVWNKSHREHTTIRSSPVEVREEADQAVEELGWNYSYYVDADHISLKNVDLFIESSDFFTLDVADFTGCSGDDGAIAAFVEVNSKYIGDLTIPGIDAPFVITEELLSSIASKYLLAVQEAGKLYRHIESAKGAGNFVTEVSMDETDLPQTPVELFFILCAIADEKIPAQTVAPKFSGRFNKGVDYVGDVAAFEKEFNEDLAVIAYGIKELGLLETLKLSVHSGSDKFSIYGPIGKALKKFNTGVHIKTAGTTWLEELIGLSISGDAGLAIAKDVYVKALGRFDELCSPYANVIDINTDNLPSAEVVQGWTGEQYSSALRHNQVCSEFNPDFRQLLHVGYKVAAEMESKFTDALKTSSTIIAEQVTENIFARHITPLFLPERG